MERLVNTKSGKIQGIEDGELLKFLGIPYAKKPVGELRFKRAQEVEPWEGVLQADHYSDPAPQFDHGQLQGSEDCLTLNVVRPKEGEKLPVFVWIHGGGYMTGCACDSLYDGENFAKKGVLYVSIQYRLNVLGFFDFCTYAGCEDFETNRGLSDMATALQWIKENIEAFGGDPENITIGGESAGGAAVVTLMAVPAVKGCFQKVIAQSALCNCVMTVEQARENMDLYIEGMGWKEADLQKLRTMPVLDMIEGLGYLSAKHQYKNPGIFLPGPVIDDLLPMRPLDAIAAGSAKGVDMIIGTNLNEGTMFVHPENTGFPNSWDMVQEMFVNNGYEERLDAIKGYYTQIETDPKYGDTFVHFATDYAFEMPSVQAALEQSKYGKTYMYRYEFLSKNAKENGMLVSHAFDLPCVFGVIDHEFSQMLFAGEDQETIERMIEDMQTPWINFIKTGNPDLNNWPTYSDANSPVRIFDRNTHTENIDRSKMMNLWSGMRFYEN